MRVIKLFLMLVALFGSQQAPAGEGEKTCRVAFDVGSSGIRVGTSDHLLGARAEIDYLKPLWAGRGLAETITPTVMAFRDLPGVPAAECEQVAGGFSAWRLSLSTRRAETVDILARIQAQSGVALLVIPQSVEGAYGAYGARQQLGERLRTSHILDIGGGSLQIAGERHSYGEALGQKIWHRLLCQALRNEEAHACHLQPMSSDELTLARRLADERLQGVARALPESVTMTAISRPVTRGVYPALVHLAGLPTDGRLLLSELSAGIERLAPLAEPETATRSGTAVDRVQWLFSDMLLVEALLRATGGASLQVAELDLTNVPGLLADEQAFAWRRQFACYLERLRELGESAYSSDPATCPAAR
jgi:hypothetical protein